jgi:hypothetical protein
MAGSCSLAPLLWFELCSSWCWLVSMTQQPGCGWHVRGIVVVCKQA